MLVWSEVITGPETRDDGCSAIDLVGMFLEPVEQCR